MSTEPKRQIEKQLKACADKRRAEAGAPFEMHPATRRLLHGEIARKTSQSPGWLPLLTKGFFQIWPRFAFVIPLLMLGVLVLFYKVLDHKQPLEMAKKVPPSTVRAADESEASGVAQRTLAEAARSEERMERARATPNESPKAEATLVAQQPAPALQIADEKKAARTSVPTAKPSLKTSVASAASEDSRRQLAVNSPASSTPALSVAPVPVKSAAPTTSTRFYAGKETDRLNSERSFVASETQGFGRVDALPARGGDADRYGLKTVLLSFQMEQSGDQLRVIDRDGSTYFGYLQKADATSAQQLVGGKGQAANQGQKTKALVATPSAKLEGKLADEVNQDYFFRVAGTNRSLNQQVIFTGHLLANTGNTDLPKNNLNTMAAKQLQLPAQNPTGSRLLNSRIHGAALVGASNTVEIQAVPVAPK